MKYLLLLLLVFASLSAMAGNDKGNVGGETYVSTQDLLIQYGVDLHEITYAKLQQKRAVVVSDQVLVPELELLGIKDGVRRPEVAPLIVLIKELLRRNEIELLKSITTSSDEFYEALGTIELLSEIDSLKASQQEKLLAKRHVQLATKTFWKSVQEEVLSDLGPAAWLTFVKSADTKRLGYSLEK